MNALSLLMNKGFPSHTLATVFRMSVDDVDTYIDEYERACTRIKDDYEDSGRQQVQAEIEEWLEEFPEEFRCEMRLRGLQNEIDDTKLAFLEACKEWSLVPDKTFGAARIAELEVMEKKLYRLDIHAKVLAGKKEGITSEQIIAAREFPIGEIIKSKNGMTTCPFHPDSTPSMDTRKNFYYCHGCGAKGDVIDLTMKIEGLTFAQAIDRLTR